MLVEIVLKYIYIVVKNIFVRVLHKCTNLTLDLFSTVPFILRDQSLSECSRSWQQLWIHKAYKAGCVLTVVFHCVLCGGTLSLGRYAAKALNLVIRTALFIDGVWSFWNVLGRIFLVTSIWRPEGLTIKLKSRSTLYWQSFTFLKRPARIFEATEIWYNWSSGSTLYWQSLIIWAGFSYRLQFEDQREKVLYQTRVTIFGSLEYVNYSSLDSSDTSAIRNVFNIHCKL